MGVLKLFVECQQTLRQMSTLVIRQTALKTFSFTYTINNHERHRTPIVIMIPLVDRVSVDGKYAYNKGVFHYFQAFLTGVRCIPCFIFSMPILTIFDTYFVIFGQVINNMFFDLYPVKQFQDLLHDLFSTCCFSNVLTRTFEVFYHKHFSKNFDFNFVKGLLQVIPDF